MPAGNHSLLQPGAGFQYTAQQAPRTHAAQQPFQISVPAAGATYAGTLRQPDVPSVTTVYHGNGLVPAPQQDAPPLVPPPTGFGGVTGGLGGVPTHPLPGYKAAMDTSDASFGLATFPVNGRAGDPLGSGLAGTTATAQWAHSAALTAAYVPGIGALGPSSYGAQDQIANTTYGSTARTTNTTNAAGLVSNAALSRSLVAGAFATGNGIATPGYAALAAATAAGAATQHLPQQQLQKGTLEQPQTDPSAAAVVAEHLEAAHRAYKAGRHLEALQLCNTVC